MELSDEQLAEVRSARRAKVRKRLDDAIMFLGGQCVTCGSTDLLEFDHIDPSTKTSMVSNMGAARLDRFWQEVSKCQLLCKPCHILKTRAHTKTVAHGTLTRYQYGCRCDMCSTTAREYHFEYYYRNRKLAQGRMRLGESAYCEGFLK